MSDEPSAFDIDRLRELWHAGTQGKWTERHEPWRFAAVHDDRGGEIACLPYERTKDAVLIVAVINALPALLDIVGDALKLRDSEDSRNLNTNRQDLFDTIDFYRPRRP